MSPAGSSKVVMTAVMLRGLVDIARSAAWPALLMVLSWYEPVLPVWLELERIRRRPVPSAATPIQASSSLKSMPA